MGYFQVRYDSRVVIYDHKMFKRLATGLVLMAGDSCSDGCGFESQHRILVVCCKICVPIPSTTSALFPICIIEIIMRKGLK